MPPGDMNMEDSAAAASSRLMKAELFVRGAEIWVEDEDEVYVLAEVERQENTILHVLDRRTHRPAEVDLGFAEVFPTNPKVVSDMTALFHIHEPGILANLRDRISARDPLPHTFMGTLLIAVNPLRRLTDPPMQTFLDKPLDPEKPHPYAIAELAYHQLRLGKTGGGVTGNQSIVVSGESGAGKTETSKIVLKYLARRSQGGISGLDEKVVESSPIMEAFGNAKTLRNDNSSRFGKFIKLQFKEARSLAGGAVETYLLEKSRVLTQAPGERSFHIFYQLLAGAPAQLRAELSLRAPEEFPTLNRSGCVRLQGVDDAEGFREVSHALATAGLDTVRQKEVWSGVAAVLHLASIEFSGKDTLEGETAQFKDHAQAALVGNLLGVGERELQELLCQKVVKARGESFTKALDVQEASYARDASAKALYEALFLWVVRQINMALGQGRDSLPFIGVLDIFGFENFKRNEFEQLLINYTNESLQNTFNKQVFSNELRLYEEEGIDVVVSSCPDNSECIELLSAKIKGVIPCLNTVCKEPNPSDVKYCERLHKEHGKNPSFPSTHRKDQRDSFIIKHYAGKVKYMVEGWVVRNMDKIPEAFGDSFGASSLSVVKGMVDILIGGGGGGGASRAAAGAARAVARPYVAQGFMDSMGQLNAVLGQTTCLFVRCIKPNAAMKPGEFNNRYVVEQLQCLGILQTCEVLKVGMPTRVTYTELKAVLGPHARAASDMFAGEPEVALISAILWAFEIPPDVYRLGKTRVFFKAGMISQLEGILRSTTPERAELVVRRLAEALENRRRAKAAAEEAEAAVSAALAAFASAREVAHATLGMAAGSSSSFSGGAVGGEGDEQGQMASEEDAIVEMTNTLKKAYKAAQCAEQVDALVAASEEDHIGRYAPDAKRKVAAAAPGVKAAAVKAGAAAAALEKPLSTAKGGHEKGPLQRLRDELVALECDGEEARRVVADAGDAAAKCQKDRALALLKEAKTKAAILTAGAERVSHGAAAAKAVAQQRHAALVAAKAASGPAAEAAAVAQAAYADFKAVVAAAGEEERAAGAKHEDENKQRRAKEAADAEVAMRRAKERQDEERDSDTDLSPSAAPAMRGGLIDHMRQQSCSVRDLLDSESKEPGSSQQKPGEGKVTSDVVPMRRHGHQTSGDISGAAAMASVTAGLAGVAVSIGRQASSDGQQPSEVAMAQRGGGGRTFLQTFQMALEGGKIEGHLMKQTKYLSRWKPRYFVLDDGRLEYYEKKSQVNGRKKKTMELQSSSTTSYTNTKNCFCVRTGENVLFLLAKDEEIMNKWMTGINAQVHALYLKTYPVPADNYWGKGLTGRFFYRMTDFSLPQWIRTYPEHDAPRTGDGIFPLEVIEVVQVLNRNGVAFLRLADDRGWTYTHHPQDQSVLFEEIHGEICEDSRSYGFPSRARDPVPILYGPGLESQQTGEALMPGERAEAIEKFTPADGSGVVFIKLKDGRGWVPVKKKNGAFGIMSGA